MDMAIVGVCSDRRQKSILELALPTWKAYARRCGVPVHILERSYAGPHFYWTKHLLFKAPELKRYDSLLFLDNDVFISDEAPSIFETPATDRIGATFESTQASWSPKEILEYYRAYGVPFSAPIPQDLGVINTGVMVIPRNQASFLESTFEDWKKNIGQLAGKLNTHQAPFAYEADQPYVSYALQKADRFANFGEGFNTLWWHWYKNNIRNDRRPFLFRSKSAALLRPYLPVALWRRLFSREIALFQQARDESAFLHVAGSKSAAFLSQP